jgi:hypothetical protein
VVGPFTRNRGGPLQEIVHYDKRTCGTDRQKHAPTNEEAVSADDKGEMDLRRVIREDVDRCLAISLSAWRITGAFSAGATLQLARTSKPGEPMRLNSHSIAASSGRNVPTAHWWLPVFDEPIAV